MMNTVFISSYEEPEFNRKEILRYAQCRETSEDVKSLMEECIAEVSGKLPYKVCWREVCINLGESFADFGFMRLESENLRKNLDGCSQAVLFGATVGIYMDRLIAKYSRVSPAKAVMMQAVGAERIEALCDAFSADVKAWCEKNGHFTKPRFSPGYGDLSLETQKDIFRVLDCPKNIGLSLSDSLLMTPTKSVTAIIGITESEQQDKGNKCTDCQNFDCQFRS